MQPLGIVFLGVHSQGSPLAIHQPAICLLSSNLVEICRLGVQTLEFPLPFACGVVASQLTNHQANAS